MRERWPPTTGRPPAKADDRLTEEEKFTGTGAAPPQHNGDKELETIETMMRTAIEALSPDAEEIGQRLARAQNEDEAPTDRPLGLRLVLVVVILVFLILAADLLLAGV